MTEALTVLATNGGAALAAAMATDAWQAARNGTARLFGRQGSDRQAAIEAQLDGNVVLVERAGDRVQARQRLVPLWEMELIRLLEDHPEAEAELRELVSHIREALPAGQQRWAQVQVNIAHGNSRQFAALGGNVIYHQHPSPAEGVADDKSG
ncbi:hypothetical protein [Micromonospora sp. 15K316]|uniref:hypothetical protein n=1 Tax=Micromonospora sp. 15K316 TaxID=2530376 RepID=UPI0010519AF3|nr:hypothetical protein [Micromonospora sp. 15K316]